MRILIVHNYYRDRGGEDVVVDTEASLLRSHGHEVDILAAHNTDIAGPLQQALVALLTPFNPVAQSRLRQHVRDFRPDVVHVHNVFPQFSPAIFRTLKAMGIPVVLTLHNFRILCPTAVLYHDGRICERSLSGSSFWTVPQRVYRGSLMGTLALSLMVEMHKWLGTWRNDVDCFIALTPFARAKFASAGIPEDRIIVKGNAVADPLPDPKHQGPRRGALYVGRLSPEKGISTLLQAWQQLDIPLRIAGDGPLRAECEAAQGASITCLGRLDPARVSEEMQKAEVLVLPSVCYEMFPVTLVEAAAHGLPVITSRLGALPDLVEEGASGLLFDPGNPDSLAEKIRWAAMHASAMARMGERARELWQAHYTPQHSYRKLMDAYEAARFRNEARVRNGSRGRG